MINGNRVLALIPARGGSKGLPGKNLRELCGKPLIAWTIEAAKSCPLIDDVVVSSDDAKIISVAKEYGALVPFVRPAELATDTASSVDVAMHALTELAREGKSYEYLVLLEPTSPLRGPSDLHDMLTKLDAAREFTSIVSVGEVAAHPFLTKSMTERGEITNLIDNGLQTARRQDLPEALFPFGVGYIVRVEAFKSERAFYTQHCLGHKIKKHQCFEIDDIYDFSAIEGVMNHLNGTRGSQL